MAPIARSYKIVVEHTGSTDGSMGTPTTSAEFINAGDIVRSMQIDRTIRGGGAEPSTLSQEAVGVITEYPEGDVTYLQVRGNIDIAHSVSWEGAIRVPQRCRAGVTVGGRSAASARARLVVIVEDTGERGGGV